MKSIAEIMEIERGNKCEQCGRDHTNHWGAFAVYSPTFDRVLCGLCLTRLFTVINRLSGRNVYADSEA